MFLIYKTLTSLLKPNKNLNKCGRHTIFSFFLLNFAAVNTNVDRFGRLATTVKNAKYSFGTARIPSQ